MLGPSDAIVAGNNNQAMLTPTRNNSGGWAFKGGGNKRLESMQGLN